MQVALLLTLDALAELAVVPDAAGMHGTHIGCSPLDGFVAFRQVLDCPACGGAAAAEAAAGQVSFLIKVRAVGRAAPGVAAGARGRHAMHAGRQVPRRHLPASRA
jgi:hypothetical protein